MSDTVTAPLVTTEELLAMPEDDGVERELIRGHLVERPMTRRSRKHSRITGNVAYLCNRWLHEQAARKWIVLAGEAGFRLHRNPDTTVGIDVALVSAELDAAMPEKVGLIEGAPLLAVEILSPSDKHEDVADKVQVYLEAGVRLVWLIDPDLRTVTVYRPDAPAQIFSPGQELTADPDLQGFRIAVEEVFA